MAAAARVVVALLLVSLTASCGDEGDSGAQPVTTTTSPAVVSSEPATTETSSLTSTTSLPPYGSACRGGSHPDCIDPDKDGRYEYLRGGADCMKNFAHNDQVLCSDLDGDGVAGYPDSG